MPAVVNVVDSVVSNAVAVVWIGRPGVGVGSADDIVDTVVAGGGRAPVDGGVELTVSAGLARGRSLIYVCGATDVDSYLPVNAVIEKVGLIPTGAACIGLAAGIGLLHDVAKAVIVPRGSGGRWA